MSQGALRPSGKSRNSNPTLVSQAGSTSVSLHPEVPSPPDYVEIRPLSRTFPPKFLRGAGRSTPEGNTLRIRRVCRSLVSMLNRRLNGRGPVLESPRSVANCHVHGGRVLDTRVETSGSERRRQLARQPMQSNEVPTLYVSRKACTRYKKELPVQLSPPVHYFRRFFPPEPEPEANSLRLRDAFL